LVDNAGVSFRSSIVAIANSLKALRNEASHTTSLGAAIELAERRPALRLLLPGMFARAVVTSGSPQRHLTVPQTAVTYNPYGTTVFIAVVKENAQGQRVLTAQQSFIQAGATRGDQVAVLSGLKEGDMVITSGQMKLKNGSPVKIDNSNQPTNDASPTPQEK
jgi:membrane fusion protein (multidrug efflux system)